jgi:hypothetical protein
VLSKSQLGLWLSMIAEHTPKHVKSILALYQPPNIAQLESVEWSTTTAMGVYVWVLKPKGLPAPFDYECYLWVGSASKYRGGLTSRKSNLLSSSCLTQNEAPKPDIRVSRTWKRMVLVSCCVERVRNNIMNLPSGSDTSVLPLLLNYYPSVRPL